MRRLSERAVKRGIETEKEMGKNAYIFGGKKDYIEGLEHTVIRWYNPESEKRSAIKIDF